MNYEALKRIYVCVLRDNGRVKYIKGNQYALVYSTCSKLKCWQKTYDNNEFVDGSYVLREIKVGQVNWQK